MNATPQQKVILTGTMKQWFAHVSRLLTLAVLLCASYTHTLGIALYTYIQIYLTKFVFKILGSRHGLPAPNQSDPPRDCAICCETIKEIPCQLLRCVHNTSMHVNCTWTWIIHRNSDEELSNTVLISCPICRSRRVLTLSRHYPLPPIKSRLVYRVLPDEILV